MKDLFFMGGALFMSILTLLLVVMTVWIVYYTLKGYANGQSEKEKALRQLKYGKSIGLFAMVTGIFGQLIGFYEAFTAIEQAGDISPALVYGGIKVSMITTLYGISIYLFSLLLWFIASQVVERR